MRTWIVVTAAIMIAGISGVALAAAPPGTPRTTGVEPRATAEAAPADSMCPAGEIAVPLVGCLNPRCIVITCLSSDASPASKAPAGCADNQIDILVACLNRPLNPR